MKRISSQKWLKRFFLLKIKSVRIVFKQNQWLFLNRLWKNQPFWINQNEIETRKVIQGWIWNCRWLLANDWRNLIFIVHVWSFILANSLFQFFFVLWYYHFSSRVLNFEDFRSRTNLDIFIDKLNQLLFGLTKQNHTLSEILLYRIGFGPL